MQREKKDSLVLSFLGLFPTCFFLVLCRVETAASCLRKRRENCPKITAPTTNCPKITAPTTNCPKTTAPTINCPKKSSKGGNYQNFPLTLARYNMLCKNVHS